MGDENGYGAGFEKTGTNTGTGLGVTRPEPVPAPNPFLQLLKKISKTLTSCCWTHLIWAAQLFRYSQFPTPQLLKKKKLSCEHKTSMLKKNF